ncbi:MAG: hypothetical protein ABJF10_07515 [Chthoniobacter sp.]|uniref:hypothetical protein n=1 Tax=Chthoniobacter sp. TaxID=2510640 RepID=UPI0032A18411
MPNTDQKEGLERNLELLANFGRLKKKRSSATNLHDPQVARSVLDWREALIKPLPPPPPDRFVRQLRYTENGMRFTLRVNAEFIVIDVDAPFGGNILCSFGCKPRLHASFAQSNTLSTTFGVPVFLESGSMSQDAPPLLGRLSILERVRELRLTGLESLHIRNGQAALYLRRYSFEHLVQIVSILKAILAELPESQEAKVDLRQLPAEFHSLISLITKWGISDDDERNERLSKASSRTRQKLIATVAPQFKAINRYLGSFRDEPLPEHASMLGALAECAAEAQVGIGDEKSKLTG